MSGNTLDIVLTLNSSHESFPLSNFDVTSCTGTTSDHFLICCDLPISCVNNVPNKDTERETKVLREYHKIDIEKFREDIFCSSLNLLSDYGSLDEAVKLYEDVVLEILDKHAPTVSKSFRSTQSPWWNNKCQEAKTAMRKAQRCFRKYPSQETKTEYKEKLIDKAIIINRERNLFYNNQLSSVKGDAKRTYQVINCLKLGPI